LTLLSASSLHGKILATAFIALLVPLVAYLYGTATGLVLKLLKIE
jgi:hypothetical protein